MSILVALEARVPSRNTDRRAKIIGWAAIGVTVAIWAGFALSIRHIGNSPLTTADVALIRFGVPTLIMLPFLQSRWSALRAVRLHDALMVIAGAGLPFFFLAAMGGAATSATYVGALIAGTAPMSVVIVGRLLSGCFPANTRWYALVIIMAGVAALIMAPAASGTRPTLSGIVLLLGASLLWGTYTLGLQRSCLDAIGCALLLAPVSFLALLLMMATGLVPSNFGRLAWADAGIFLISQGLGVGVVASLAYVMAIRRLGAARSAVIGSLAPALASLLAIPLLGETPTLAVLLGIGAITLGVFLANRS